MSCLVCFAKFRTCISTVMYHLLKGLHEHLTRLILTRFTGVYSFASKCNNRKEEFSVIIIGLDGAGKTVRLSLYHLFRSVFIQTLVISL